MSECADRFRELTRHVDTVLDEDLPALRRLSERERIERYNELKRNEEELLWEFDEECPQFLTHSERARVRGNFRLARLLITASFYSEDGGVPPALTEEFVEAELDAVVEFDRYRQFDALSESQIESKIRQMDGEVYELVEEYTSTQLATIEALLEQPNVQQDLMERLLERYETRREKIRQGFFTYVETHGLEHTVGAIEEAVEAVNTASTERAQVQAALQESREAVTATETGAVTDRQQLDAQIQQLDQQVDPNADGNWTDAEVAELRTQIDAIAEKKQETASEIDAHIERTTELDRRLEAQIETLQEQSATSERVPAEISEQTRELVERELEGLQEERKRIKQELNRLERERAQVDAARETLEEKQNQLEDERSQVRKSTGSSEESVEGSNAVTAKMARLLEMDYLGRFDISMHETESIHTDEGPFRVSDGYWEGRSYRRNNRGYLVSILEDESPDTYPVNETSRYEMTSSGTLGLGSQTETVIEAQVLSNLHAHVENGFDASPADLDALLSVVNEAVAEAEEGEYTYLLGLASPTGWSDRVRKQIENDGRSKTRYSKHLSLCLINLQDGSLIYDESDPLVAENADLFAPPVATERVTECVETVRNAYVDDVGQESVLLRDVVEEYGYDAQIVKRAFNRLEQDGVGEQLYLDELGLSLTVGR